jgi:hypothetical protein
MQYEKRIEMTLINEIERRRVMTLRFLDLTILFRFLSVELKDQTDLHSSQMADKVVWYQQLGLMTSRAKQRRQLLSLSDERLDDIGLTRAQVIEEANKPFWKA